MSRFQTIFEQLFTYCLRTADAHRRMRSRRPTLVGPGSGTYSEGSQRAAAILDPWHLVPKSRRAVSQRVPFSRRDDKGIGHGPVCLDGPRMVPRDRLAVTPWKRLGEHIAIAPRTFREKLIPPAKLLRYSGASPYQIRPV